MGCLLSTATDRADGIDISLEDSLDVGCVDRCTLHCSCKAKAKASKGINNTVRLLTFIFKL